jgi:hypothetical protein
MTMVRPLGFGNAIARAGLIIAVCAAAFVVANAQVRTGPRGLDACKLLSDVKGSAIIAHAQHRSPGSTWLSCEYTDIAPEGNNLDAQWRAGFGFVPHTTAAEAEASWQQSYSKWQGTNVQSASSTSSVSRLRFYGADDAFIVETKRTDPQPGAREAMVYWRKGRWVGTLQLRARLTSNLGDVEDAEAIMKSINWAAFPK